MGEFSDAGENSVPSSDAGRNILKAEGIVTTDLSDYLIGAFPRAPFEAKPSPDTCAVLSPLMDEVQGASLHESVLRAIAEDSAGGLNFSRKDDKDSANNMLSDLELSSNGKVIYSESWNRNLDAYTETMCQTRDGRNVFTWPISIPIHKDIDDKHVQTAESPGINACSSGFPKPGGFDFSAGDIEETFSAQNNTSSVTYGVIRQIANKADLDCSGTLSKNELEEFKNNPDVGPKTRHVAEHLLKNFDKLATFTRGDWSEYKDSDARAMVEKYFKDSAADTEISKKDLHMLGYLPDLDLERHKAIKEDGYLGIVKGTLLGGGKVQAFNKLVEKLSSSEMLQKELLNLR